MKSTAATILTAVFLLAPHAYARKPTRLIPERATVYVIPSEVSDRLTHFIRRPPLGAGKLSKANLRIADTPNNASYSLACKFVRFHEHGTAVNLIGSYLPVHTALEIRELPSGRVLFYREKDSGGGSDAHREDMSARICALVLAQIVQ